MSNIKKNSIIAVLDFPEDSQAVLDSSIWISNQLNIPIGLLYSIPSYHKKNAVNYSGCLNIDEEEHLLNTLADEEHLQNVGLKSQGKQALKQVQSYCQENGNQDNYPLHRQCTIEESIHYVDKDAQLIVANNSLTSAGRSHLSKLIRLVQTPILITNSPFIEPKSALFAFDNKETCHHIIKELSSSLLSPIIRNMPVHIVMVAENNDENKDALREAYAKLTQSGIHCVKKIIDINKMPNISNALIAYQEHHELELLITGAFGQSRLHEWIMGSETEDLLSKHNTPYLLFSKE